MSGWDAMLEWRRDQWQAQINAKVARIKEELTGYVAGELCLHCWCEGGHTEHCARPRPTSTETVFAPRREVSERFGVAHLQWADGFEADGDTCGYPKPFSTKKEAEAYAHKMNAEGWPRERWWVEPFDESGPPKGPQQELK
jgi:hypothetical protein